IVESGDHTLILQLAQENIRTLIRSEMPELPAAKRRMLVANPQQFLHIRKNLLLLARSSRLRERVVGVPGPAAGKIAPVIWVASSRHCYLIAVVNLLDAEHSQRLHKLQFPLRS